MTNHQKVDIIIVGAGPIGLACGIEAEKRGLNYQIIEKGCLVNSIYHYPLNMTFFSTSEKIEIGEVPFVSHGPKPNRSEALEYYRRVAKKWNLKINTYEKVLGMEPLEEGYEIRSDKSNYFARSVVLATGFYDHPNLLDIPGESLSKVKHYYTEAHPYIDKKLIVIGAANSAIDVALECWRKGAEVSLVVRNAEISHRVKYWVRPDIDNRIKEGSITAYFNSELTEIRETEVDIKTPEGLVSLENDFVLAMTGYHPDFGWLQSLGIDISPEPECFPYRNEHTFETNLQRVYLAGTICGGMRTSKWFIENSIEHAAVVMDQIAESLSKAQPQV